MSDICRLCLGDHLVNQDIFGDGGIYGKLKACLPISIEDNDTLPKKICMTCVDKIHDIDSYFQNIVSVQKQLLLSSKDKLEMKFLVFQQLDVKQEPNDENFQLVVTQTTNQNVNQHSKFTQTDLTDFTYLDSVNNLETKANIILKDDLDKSAVRIKIEKIETVDILNNAEERDHNYSSDDDLALSSIIIKSSYIKKNTLDEKKISQHNDGITVKRSRGRPKGSVKKIKVEKQKKRKKVVSVDKHFYPEGMAEELKKWQCLICFTFFKARSDLLSHYKEHLVNPSKFLLKTESDLTKTPDGVDVGLNVLEGAEIAAKNDVKAGNDYAFINNPDFGDTPAYQCLKCLKIFLHKKAIVRHLICHDNSRPFPCNVCGRTYKKPYEILLHGRVHNGFKTLICKHPLCDYKTVYRGALFNHIKRHEATGDFKYKCEICNKGFDVLTWYNEHKNVHLGIKPFTCDVCGKSFTYSRYLTAHRKCVHPEVEEKLGNQLLHSCPYCNKKFSYRCRMTAHIKAEHEARRLPGQASAAAVLCDICGKGLSTKEHLKFHRRIHTGEKPFTCRTCGKGFVKKCNMTLHERVHSGEKPHVCSNCGKAFSQRSTLIIHERYHSGARPYVCSNCDKGFVAKGLLSMHQKTCI